MTPVALATALVLAQRAIIATSMSQSTTSDPVIGAGNRSMPRHSGVSLKNAAMRVCLAPPGWVRFIRKTKQSSITMRIIHRARAPSFNWMALTVAMKHYRNVWLIFNQLDGELRFVWPQVTCPHTYPTVIHRACGKPFLAWTNIHHRNELTY